MLPRRWKLPAEHRAPWRWFGACPERSNTASGGEVAAEEWRSGVWHANLQISPREYWRVHAQRKYSLHHHLLLAGRDDDSRWRQVQSEVGKIPGERKGSFLHPERQPADLLRTAEESD